MTVGKGWVNLLPEATRETLYSLVAAADERTGIE